MKSLNGKLAAMAAMLAIATTAASAQTVALKASIPFAFNVGKQTMPAGDYRIPMNAAHYMVISNVGEHTTRIAGANALVTNPTEQPRLVFECRASHCALRQVHAGGGWGYEFPAKWSGPDAKELARVVTVPVSSAY